MSDFQEKKSGLRAALPVALQVDTMDAGSGWTPLMRVSAVSGNQKVASLLIDAGADVNMKDKDGKTPLMVRLAPHSSLA